MKELFKELNIETAKDSSFQIEPERIWYFRVDGDTLHSYITVDNLVKKCKAWANTKGYKIISYFDDGVGYALATLDTVTEDGWLKGETENGAIIKASLWIIEQGE